MTGHIQKMYTHPGVALVQSTAAWTSGGIWMLSTSSATRSRSPAATTAGGQLNSGAVPGASPAAALQAAGWAHLWLSACMALDRTRNQKRKAEDGHDEEHGIFDAGALRDHEEFTKVCPHLPHGHSPAQCWTPMLAVLCCRRPHTARRVHQGERSAAASLLAACGSCIHLQYIPGPKSVPT